eukprot:gnl/TRDRNA2_/TRDRNA2_64812_c0_seq1.p1 gnl/TRDRNA2_/TRDRNA2_64812_c0~~gnl/TRDRNA2_/TRDRNA2_64812_c0_seq1.p1  ORF type:complete len:466 (+),score=87.35 gnl/TRDRNA2_/TRDRNA2_64812_c0_seq1:59-1456(+)
MPPLGKDRSASQTNGAANGGYVALGPVDFGQVQQDKGMMGYIDSIDVKSDCFNMVVGVVIMGNAIILGLETDQGPERYVVFEHLLQLFFIVEMSLRIRQLRREWPKDPWNIFDAMLVCTGSFQLYIWPFIAKHGHGGTMMSLLRLARMTRVLRLLRLFRMFNMLSMILKNFMRAITVVMWVGLLIIIFDYIWAILLTQMIGHNAAIWGDKEPQIKAWFGTMGSSMQTLFTVMTLAEWQSIALTLEEVLPRGLVFICMILYIFVASYTMLSLIVGMITESLVRGQKEKMEVRDLEIQETRKIFFNGLRMLLETYDADGDGCVRRVEVKRVLEQHPEIMPRLAALDIFVEQEEIVPLFNVLEDGKPVAIPIFIEALGHIGAEAKANSIFDLKHTLGDCRMEASDRATQTQKDMEEIRLNMSWLRANVKADLTNVHSDVLHIKGDLLDFLAKVNRLREERNTQHAMKD